MKRLTLAVLAAMIMFPGAGRGQEAITIKLKELTAGDSSLVKKTEKSTNKLTATVGEKVVLDQTDVKGQVMEYQETVLARAAGKLPSKLERAYTKAQISKANEAKDVDLAGKTVVIEKKEGKYEFSLKDGGILEGPGAVLLVKEFSKKSDTGAELEKLMLPQGAVKPGQSWKIDMPKIIAEIGRQGDMKIDGEQASGQGTLVKAYQKDGRQYGELRFKMEMGVISAGAGKGELKFGAGAKIVLNMTLNACIDGSSDAGTLATKMLMTGNATTPNGAVLSFNVAVDSMQVHSEAKK